MIVIVDYGMGNLRSVEKAAAYLGVKVKVSSSVSVIRNASKLILPGVGHFGKAVVQLQQRKLFSLLQERIKNDVPFLGICLGMQLLFDMSDEAPNSKGLGIFPGKVVKFKGKGLIVPHMGWNEVSFNPAHLSNKVIAGINDKSAFYFVHSYYCVPRQKQVVLGTSNYGKEFAAAVYRDNVWAVQFHPEKSQRIGLRLYKNFLFAS